MRIEWMLLAEGLGQDAKGAFTLIGVNQNLLVTATLPAMTKRVVFAHLVLDDEGDEVIAGPINFSFRVEGPSHRVIAAATGGINVGPKNVPELPATLDLPAELVLNTQEYGEHDFILEVTGSDGSHAVATASLFVLPPERVNLGGVSVETLMRPGIPAPVGHAAKKRPSKRQGSKAR